MRKPEEEESEFGRLHEAGLCLLAVQVAGVPDRGPLDWVCAGFFFIPMTQSDHLQNHSESGLHFRANLLSHLGKKLLQVVFEGILTDGSSLVLEHLPVEGEEVAEDGPLVEELVLESSGL